MIKKINDIQELWQFKDSLDPNKKIAFVPTMGALHDGHLSLMKEGLKSADIVIASIFVNPTQFAPNEDLSSYPRTLDEDLNKLENVGVQAVWIPTVEDIYPNGPETDIHVVGITDPLEGEFRPQFFDGVATVVARLLCAVESDIALFGEKDFQQLQVIKTLVSDLGLPIEIRGVPTMRDKNGLALSSRNAYLSVDEYDVAVQLNKILKELSNDNLNEKQACQKLLDAGFDKVDYCTKRHSKTLQADTDHNDRVLAAVHIGKTRLIDNMKIKSYK